MGADVIAPGRSNCLRIFIGHIDGANRYCPSTFQLPKRWQIIGILYIDGFVRIFFYVNGFEAHDAGLKVVPGSHLFRDQTIRATSDDELSAGWMAGKRHPITGEPLSIEELSVPEGTVILMWTHAAHGVNPRLPASDTRWTVVYAYRNPGRESRARWISPDFEHRPIAGAESLLSLY